MNFPIGAQILPSYAAAPLCPHFGPCGGCQLQDVAYQIQLAHKAERLRELLEPTGVALPQVQLHASPPFGYRNRIRLTLAEVDGRLRAGYIRQTTETSHAFLPITECPIAAPVLWRAAESLLALANASPAGWARTADQLEIFTTADEARLQFTLILRTAAKRSPLEAAAFAALCESMCAAVHELSGAGISLLPPASPNRGRRLEQPRPGPSWSAPGLSYTVGETSYWVPRTAFFQVNRFLLPELVSRVTAGREGQLAWDLYAGVGLFSRALARVFTEVVAVEIAEPAASALAATKLANLHAVKATTLDFLRAAVIQRERPKLIVLDPPRTGAGPEICGLLARIAAPTLVYVSCSPQMLAAELAALTANGYTLAELHLFDLFPQTDHIETVAILQR